MRCHVVGNFAIGMLGVIFQGRMYALIVVHSLLVSH